MARKALSAEDFGTVYHLPRLEHWGGKNRNHAKRVTRRCKPPATVQWVMLNGTSMLVRYDVLASLLKRLRGTAFDVEWPCMRGNPDSLVFRYKHGKGHGTIRLALHGIEPAAKAVGARAA